MYEGRNVHFTTNNKPLCSFSGKLCNLRRLNGYAFCVRHILEDSSAPFKQCSYVVKTSGLKCTSAIPGAENREYCNAHMQVMGIIPKKERKKRTEPLYVSESHGIHSIDTSRLPNGYSISDSKRQHNFSASKMFPELAGKLSFDNQKSVASSEQLNKSLNRSSPKSATAASLSSKRSRRPTRKSLSILKKKQLGLLTDEEAKACLTSSGCKTYSQYVKIRTDESELLTPLIDSSDEEDPLTSSSLLINHLREPCSPLSTSTDLNAEASDSEMYDESFTNLKRTCIRLSHAAILNEELIRFGKAFTSHFIDTVQDNPKCGVFIADKIRNPNKVSLPANGAIAEPAALTYSSVTESRKLCTFKITEERQCNAVPIPLSNFCSKHIMYNSEQKLFSHCTFTGDEENGETKICENPAFDIVHTPALCPMHTPAIIDPFDLEQDLNLRRKKKKTKPFACRRSKKRKRNVKPQKPIEASSAVDQGFSVSPEPGTLPNNLQTSPKSSSPVRPVGPEPEEELDSDTENILSSIDNSLLPLGHDDSKILDDNEIDEVLNEEGFNLFSDADKTEDGLELTEADLIFSGDGNEILDNLKGELPDDITDAILHVEYQAELEKQQQQQHQQQHQQQQHEHEQLPLQIHNVQQQQRHHMMSPSGMYEMNNGLNGYNNSNYHTLQQTYNHQGPPPDYPGATKLLPSTPQLTSPQQPHVNHSNLSYIHEQNNRFTHHQIHPKISTSSNSPQILLRQPSYQLPPTSPLSLSASSTHINSNHVPVNRMGRLPPVSTITMQQQWHSAESAPYQNGYHNPSDHPMYGLPSPPLYHTPREATLMYSTQLYNNGAYSINHQLRPSRPQHINMSLQQ